MRMIHKSAVWAILFFLLMLPNIVTALETPPLKGRVNDLAGMLSPEYIQRLEQKLASFERETSNQVAILTIPTLEGEDIDQFSIRVAEAWKLGQSGKDNGILLILAKAERKVRIEVGNGLQGVLPDITASKIIREVMRPYLKNNDFNGGISVAVDSLMSATKGEFKATPSEKKQGKKKSDGVITFLLGVFLAAVIALVAASKSKIISSLVGGLGMPLAAIAAFNSMGALTLALLAIAGLIGGFLLSLAAKNINFGNGGGGYYGGFGGGGFGGGGSSSDSSDDFSGGGGNFDGGGSSDDY